MQRPAARRSLSLSSLPAWPYPRVTHTPRTVTPPSCPWHGQCQHECGDLQISGQRRMPPDALASHSPRLTPDNAAACNARRSVAGETWESTETNSAWCREGGNTMTQRGGSCCFISWRWWRCSSAWDWARSSCGPTTTTAAATSPSTAARLAAPPRLIRRRMRRAMPTFENPGMFSLRRRVGFRFVPATPCRPISGLLR